MSESIQKKLLRVRPPRVKITYDVETGGAIEKRELPFIVGVFADLKGDRENTDYINLNLRTMTEIDRDNFNDVMKTIAPRVDLAPVKAGTVLVDILKQPEDNQLVFSNVDAFEPMQIIKALPSLKSLYDSRSQIRSLQTSAEADDKVSAALDAAIDNLQPGSAGTPAAGATAAVPGTPALADTAIDTLVGIIAAPAVAAANADIDANAALTTPAQTDAEIASAKTAAEDAIKKDIKTELAPFAEQFNQYFVKENALAVTRITEARKRGTIAVVDVLVALIDQKLSGALSAVMHSDSFKKMEATWRGLHYLVANTETSTMLKLKVFNATKDELRKDMLKAVEFDQSRLFKLIYEAEYGTFGGHPYSLLIGDYAIGSGGDDIDFLKKIAEVAAAAHAPFIAQASQELFRLTGFDKLDKPRDLKKIFESADLVGWQEFRELEDARYVSLALPRALLRLPYGMPTKRNTIACEGINFDELVTSQAANAVTDPKNDEVISYNDPEASHFLWGNPAYLLAERITNAFSLYSWTAAIRGVEGGGLIEGLPAYTYSSSTGATELFCPTEVSITDRREKELNDLGFISLCHCKGTSKAAFFGGQTTNLPKKYFSDAANANAKISAMLPYMLAASRFAHYIKVIMRDKVGSFLTRGNIESYLNSWIANYVLLDDNASQDVKACYPLREANVVVTEVPGEPGSYRATVFLKPHFQLEELTTSIRLVANLPK